MREGGMREGEWRERGRRGGGKERRGRKEWTEEGWRDGGRGEGGKEGWMDGTFNMATRSDIQMANLDMIVESTWLLIHNHGILKDVNTSAKAVSGTEERREGGMEAREGEREGGMDIHTSAKAVSGTTASSW